MIRKAFFSLLAVLASAMSSQAAVMLTYDLPTPLAGSEGLVSYTIRAVSDAGEVLNTVNNPVLLAAPGSMGAHQVGTAVTGATTPTRTSQEAGGVLWSDAWRPYDTHFLFSASNSLSIGGDFTETRAGSGESLPDGGFGTPPTGYGNMGFTTGSASKGYTVASGLAGNDIAFLQLVQKATDSATLSVNIFDNQGNPYSFTDFMITNAPVIPEPATISLLGLAAIGMFGFIRRR